MRGVILILAAMVGFFIIPLIDLNATLFLVPAFVGMLGFVITIYEVQNK